MQGETIWCNLFGFLSIFHFHRWFDSCHEFILEWLFVRSHSWTQTLCIKQGVSDQHWPRFGYWHDVSPHFSSVKAGRQQMWVRGKEFVLVLHLTELSSSSLLNHIASPEYLPFRCCVTSPVRHFDQQHLWWSYNDSTALTYLVFHLLQTKQNNSILSLLKWLRVSSQLLHYITIHVLHQWHYLILEYFIKCALEFGKVRIKLLEMTFKGKQSIFPHQ